MTKVTKKRLLEIVEMAGEVPEEYRQKCFEILLQNELKDGSAIELDMKAKADGVQEKKPPTKSDFTIPIDVKAFLSQYGLNEILLWKVFLVEGAEIRPIYKLATTKKAQVQIENALLIALETAMISGQFQFTKEQLRLRCASQKALDAANFSSILKKNTKLFNSITNDKPISLSPDGKSELADILEKFNG